MCLVLIGRIEAVISEYLSGRDEDKSHAADYCVLHSFLQHFTQYIPLSIYELETCVGNPSIYLFDCSAAGLIVNAFCQVQSTHSKYYRSGVYRL